MLELVSVSYVFFRTVGTQNERNIERLYCDVKDQDFESKLYMSSFPISRGPLLTLSILIIAVFVLRAFLSVPSIGSGFERSGSRGQISMLTFNIWFAREKMRERMEALGQIVQDLRPDILAFQEVTMKNLALLQKQRWFSRYNLIPPDVRAQDRYFVVILSRYPVDKWFIYPFKNSPYYNRKLITAETKIAVLSNVRFAIATTHLVHAGYNTRLRELQLKETLQVLSGYDNVCVMGDMNIHEDRLKVDGIVVLPSSWIDAWLSLPGNTESNGYTWDRSKNPFSVMGSSANATSYQARLDRVLCKLSDFKVKEMRIVGNKLTKSGIVPSDHFGLFTVIELLAKTEPKYDKKSKTEKEVFFKRPPDWENLVNQERMG